MLLGSRSLLRLSMRKSCFFCNFFLHRRLNRESVRRAFWDELKWPVAPHWLPPQAKYNSAHFIIFNCRFSLRWCFRGICPSGFDPYISLLRLSAPPRETHCFHCSIVKTATLASWNLQTAWARHVDVPRKNVFHAAFWVKHNSSRIKKDISFLSRAPNP